MKRQNLDSREQMLFSNGGTFERPGAARHWQEQEVVRTVRKIRLFTAIRTPRFRAFRSHLYTSFWLYTIQKYTPSLAKRHC